MTLPSIIAISALSRHGMFVEVQRPANYTNCTQGSYLVYVPVQVPTVRIMVKNGIAVIMRKRAN